jgi:hypothetical protein
MLVQPNVVKRQHSPETRYAGPGAWRRQRDGDFGWRIRGGTISLPDRSMRTSRAEGDRRRVIAGTRSDTGSARDWIHPTRTEQVGPARPS